MQQSTLTSPSCYSNEIPGIDPVYQKNLKQYQCNCLQKFNSTQEFPQQFNVFEDNDQRLFKNTHSKLISQQYLKQSPLIEKEEEMDEICSLSSIFDKQLTFDKLKKKEIFNSIESIRLDKLDQPENLSQKKSLPPPGFETQFPQDQKLTQSNIKSQEKLPTKQKEMCVIPEQCKVIFVRGLDHPSLTLQSLYNIFSNFGMIIRMLFFRQKGAMLVQFVSASQAQQCKECMNGAVFCGNAIRIFNSNHKEIKQKQQKQQMMNSGEYWERDMLCKERGKQSNPPSEVVHVANLRPEACSQEVILSIFGTFGFVSNIKFLLDDPYKKMCLVQFQTVEESLNAVAFLHGYWLYGRFQQIILIIPRQLQVSFTRSKI